MLAAAEALGPAIIPTEEEAARPPPRRALSLAQLEQRRQAGRASYRAMVRRALEAGLALLDGTSEGEKAYLDRAAQHLTGARLARGFRYYKGIKESYMAAWAERLAFSAQLPLPLAWDTAEASAESLEPDF